MATDGEDTFMWATEAQAYMRHISRLMVLLGIDWHPGDIKRSPRFPSSR